MPPDASPGWFPLEIALVVLVVAALLFLLYFWWRGRPFAKGDVFRASRLSSGNRLFPTQVLITSTSVVHYTPEWVGRREHSIHIAHVASVSIETHVLFSDVYIETTGGTTPIACRGHTRKDAVRMKQLIETYQTAYYRVGEPRAAPPPGREAPGASA